MVPAFHQSCSGVVGEWDKLVSDKGSSYEVDVWPGLVSMTADVISRTAFGRSYKEGQRIFELQAELAQLIIQAFRKAFIPGFSSRVQSREIQRRSFKGNKEPSLLISFCVGTEDMHRPELCPVGGKNANGVDSTEILP
ncbi:unnamed protein product [Arabidopsis lyrata]|uniref:cytochrome P450 72A15 isoform X1 n=1 Tax=Arabidopsis lyrata subsp. lyrata TaxID=81972 RepID=UPI000A29AAD8|nr:cytochrome P450 72A15 isoform X1 [Arabidopsis lyrata subsp. lyrata]CAH8260497.1 unnamed protein product [Arabidopsis lyrata]|eukprot:XP_020874085.1 cytochrome P450 72A15 isoform X1 [Arabidopsis lyrata subsp. lyrata]